MYIALDLIASLWPRVGTQELHAGIGRRDGVEAVIFFSFENYIHPGFIPIGTKSSGTFVPVEKTEPKPVRNRDK